MDMELGTEAKCRHTRRLSCWTVFGILTFVLALLALILSTYVLVSDVFCRDGLPRSKNAIGRRNDGQLLQEASMARFVIHTKFPTVCYRSQIAFECTASRSVPFSRARPLMIRLVVNGFDVVVTVRSVLSPLLTSLAAWTKTSPCKRAVSAKRLCLSFMQLNLSIKVWQPSLQTDTVDRMVVCKLCLDLGPC